MSELDDELNADPFDDDHFGTVVPKPINISQFLSSSERSRLEKLCHVFHQLSVEILEDDPAARIFGAAKALGQSVRNPDGWATLQLTQWLEITGLFDWQFAKALDSLKEKELLEQGQNQDSQVITLRADQEALDRLLNELYPEC